ncbi:MAG: hypothetical protein GTO41_18440 [Burkholderiales bacterium]|nr:hypothetical protein [Burkholderiales bacterium]
MLRLRRAIRHEQSVIFVLAALIGIAAGYATIGFRELIGLFQLISYGSVSEAFFASVVASLPWWHVLFGPAIGGLMIGLFVHYVMPGRRNHGVADVCNSIWCGIST